MIKFRYESITVSDGTTIDVPDSGVVIFVGPNNSGKSQALKDLIGLSRDNSYAGKAITSSEVTKIGDLGDAARWAAENFPQVDRDGIARMMVEGWGEVKAHDFAQQWMNPSEQLGILAPTIVFHADGETRLSAGNAQSNLDFRHQSPTHPIQRGAGSST